ncbi:hypothetical protein ACFWWC_45675 [Streptomyces sp. NPDC058642]|uniref:hypothetical protein n=1 Tax=Streptomyces sp. NPDC058642 TaxID=3346572 RepID=UPI0036517A53
MCAGDGVVDAQDLVGAGESGGTGPVALRAGQLLPTDVACAQWTVQEAEDLVHGYWHQLSPFYLSQSDHQQH